MDSPFYDRHGKEKFINDEIPSHKKGYFAILVKDNKVLITYPPDVDVPEFPGGSVRRKEDYRGCLYRKLYEETGIEFMLGEGVDSFFQTIECYDDAKPDGEYFIYEQTFIVYDASSFGFDTSRKMWKTPENGKAAWIDINNISSEKLKINYGHWLAFQELFLTDEDADDEDEGGSEDEGLDDTQDISDDWIVDPDYSQLIIK